MSKRCNLHYILCLVRYAESTFLCTTR